MTNNELTLDQLQAISGGAAQRNTHDGFRAEYAVRLNPDKAEIDKSSTKKEFSFGLTQPHY